MKKNLLKKVFIVSISIVIIELLIMFTIKLFRERNIEHIDALNDLVKVDDYYIGVGASDFYNSKFVDKKIYSHENKVTKSKENIIATQSKIVKYDKDLKIIWENTYNNMYDSTFYSVIAVDDGFVAVGSYVSKYSQIDLNTRDGLIVKYNLDGQIVWSHDYHVLSDTEFFKIIDDGDGNYVVIGQSIYENMEMGTHITGGGIIVRYDKDGNLLAKNNYGGNKSGSFNDIIKVNDGYIVCGKDATNYGIVVKFAKDFNRDEKDEKIISKKVLWQRTYSNTDDIGFSSMVLVDNTIYTVGAIDISTEKDQDGNKKYKYDAGIVSYNLDGKYLGSYSLKEDTHHHFNSVIHDGDELVITGLLDIDSFYNGKKQDSLVVKFSLSENKFIKRDNYQEENDYIIQKVLKFDNNKIIIGTDKNHCNLYGCEYQPVFSFIDIKA